MRRNGELLDDKKTAPRYRHCFGRHSGNGRMDLVVFHVDNPGGENHGYYRVISDL